MTAPGAASIRILGLDPGSLHTGFGLIQKSGSRLVYLDAGRFSPPPKQQLAARLHYLHEACCELMAGCAPDAVAVEDVFHAVNVRSALKLAHARGVLLLAAARHGLGVAAYPPATVKKAVVGAGAADKKQVAFMVQRLLPGVPSGVPADATDALAVALCHASHLSTAAPAVGSAVTRTRPAKAGTGGPQTGQPRGKAS